MRRTTNWLIGLGVCCVFAPRAVGQTDSMRSERINRTAYMIGYGHTKLLDTYLSAEHFSGNGVTFLSSSKKQHGFQSRWNTMMQHQANLSRLENRSRSATELEGSYDFFIGRYHRWTLLADKLSMEMGAMGNVGVGFAYNTVNGNNPAQGRLYFHLMPSGMASYRFSLWRHQLTARYEVEAALVGVMFSPNYGQSYYEMFSRGNYDHNIVPTTIISAPTFRQQLMLDVNISRKMTLRIGYLGDYKQAAVNNLKYHTYSHRLMIGIVREFKLTYYRP